MTSIILILTFTLVLLVVYTYFGYPVVLWALSRVAKARSIDKADIQPTVSMIIACYNEADIIREKISNCLDMHYPQERIEFLFVSDGSDDGSDDIIKEYIDDRIKLIRQEGRLGKTSGLNMAVPTTKGEIIVFSDANAMYEPEAVSKLVRSFNDPSVGYVVGAALYNESSGNAASESENTYWQYEIGIKKLESKVHSVVGGDGAIYGIRRALYEPLDAEDINDFVNPLQIIAKGYRGVFEAEAVCYEDAAGSFEKEGRRKERIVNRSFGGLMKVKSVMNPFKTGLFSFEVISHKLLRWLVPFFLCGIALSTAYLSVQGFRLFQVAILFAIPFLWLAAIGYYRSESTSLSAIFRMPYYFIAINYSAMHGVLSALRGNIQITWRSPREHAIDTSNLKFSRIIFLVLFFVLTLLVFLHTGRGLINAL